MRLSLTALLSSVLLAAFCSSASAELLIDIDKAAQQMSVSVDGQSRYTWPVSTGVIGHDTPSGTFKPFRMEANHFSREWDNAPMPHSVFFTQVGHAIHGTNQVRNLGRAASHGCVRLSPGNAATLFSLIKAQGMANTRITLQGDVVAPVARGGREPGYRVARQRRGYDEDGVIPVGIQAGQPRAGYRYAPQRRSYDPFGGSDYGEPSDFSDY